jgi:hypothetical protein
VHEFSSQQAEFGELGAVFVESLLFMAGFAQDQFIDLGGGIGCKVCKMHGYSLRGRCRTSAAELGD